MLEALPLYPRIASILHMPCRLISMFCEKSKPLFLCAAFTPHEIVGRPPGFFDICFLWGVHAYARHQHDYQFSHNSGNKYLESRNKYHGTCSKPCSVVKMPRYWACFLLEGGFVDHKSMHIINLGIKGHCSVALRV
jgi:hypothetical protein